MHSKVIGWACLQLGTPIQAFITMCSAPFWGWSIRMAAKYFLLACSAYLSRREGAAVILRWDAQLTPRLRGFTHCDTRNMRTDAKRGEFHYQNSVGLLSKSPGTAGPLTASGGAEGCAGHVFNPSYSILLRWSKLKGAFPPRSSESTWEDTSASQGSPAAPSRHRLLTPPSPAQARRRREGAPWWHHPSALEGRAPAAA